MSFSERSGLNPVKKIIQNDSLNSLTRVKLWNAFHSSILYSLKGDRRYKFTFIVWEFFLDRKRSDFKDESYVIYVIDNLFSKGEWWKVFDFIEFVCSMKNDNLNVLFKTCFISDCNSVLESNLSTYRISGKKIIPISNDIELNSIEESLNNDDKYQNASTHLTSALKFLSNRNKPDYRNSIKESISAVESICRIITKESTLGKALKKLENSGIRIHQQLKNAFDKLYLFTNDKQTGIRHALIEEEYNPDFDEAKFMLISCSAFINYLKAKSVSL